MLGDNELFLNGGPVNTPRLDELLSTNGYYEDGSKVTDDVSYNLSGHSVRRLGLRGSG